MPVTGSAALGPDIIRFFSAIGLHMENAYATSEGGGFHAMHRSDDIKMGTIGPPLPRTNIRITGRGEIIINSESVCQGYYKASEATEEAFENGWFHTGDAGFIDDDDRDISQRFMPLFHPLRVSQQKQP